MLQLEMQLLKGEGKIIECWLVKKMELFLNFAGEGRGGQNYLLIIGPRVA